MECFQGFFLWKSATACASGATHVADKVWCVAQRTGYPETACAVGLYASAQALRHSARSLRKRVISPLGDYLHCRALDLQRACQLTPEMQVKVSALVCLDGLVADYHRRKSAEAVSLQAGRVESTALQPILDPVADRYFMVIVPGMPPREVEPVTVKGRDIEWRVVKTAARSADGLDRPRATPDEKVVDFQTLHFSSARIPSALGASVCVIFQKLDSLKPVGFGFRTGRYEMTTAYHVLLGVRRDTPMFITSVREYEEKLASSTLVPIPLETSKVHALHCNGPRSQTGFDACRLETAESVFAQAGVQVYSSGGDMAVSGEILAIGFQPFSQQKCRPPCCSQG